MKSQSFKRAALAAGAISVAVFVSGCAALGPKPPEEVVAQRAHERGQAFIAGEVEKAYSFLAPSYRAVVDLKRYRGMFGASAKLESFSVAGVTCEAARCEVTVRIEYSAPMQRMRRPAVTHVTEQWVLEDGRWWLYRKI